MRKKIMPFALAIFSAMFVVSCSSSDNGSDKNNENNKKVNSAVLAKMQANYYWSVPTNVDNTLEPKSYFTSLLNVNDKYTISGKEYRYSSLYSSNELSSTSKAYDIGFEYGVNSYLDAMYYVIYYVKPGTDAATQKLRRGLLIRTINGETLTSANKDYLLSQAYRNGQPVVMEVVDPSVGTNKVKFTVKPVTGYKEDPIHLSEKLTVGVGDNLIGYIVYNAFTSGENGLYDSKLATELQRFSNSNFEYLVLDLRYNANGLPTSAQKLASAVVKNASAETPFIYMKGRQDKSNIAYNVTPTSASPLANKLKKVYIIAGVNTGGMSEAFVNGLKSYLGTDVVVVGETTQGRNMTTGSTYLDDKSYLINLVIGEWTNKDLKSYGKITPDSGFAVTEPAKLEPFGSPADPALAKILANITGKQTIRLSETSTIHVLGSSIERKAIDPLLNSIEIQ